MSPKQTLRWGLSLLVCLTLSAAPQTPSTPSTDSPEQLAASLGRPLTQSEIQEWELVVRLHTTLSVMYRREVTQLEALQAQTGRVPDETEWRNLMDRIGDSVVNDIRPAEKTTARSLFLGWLHHLSLSHITHSIYEIARTQGVPAASSVAFGAFMDFGAPAFCALIGHPELGPFTWLIPFEVPGYTIGHVLQNRWQRHQLTKLYGGEEGFKKFRQPFLDNITALQMDGLEDMVIPLSNKVREANGVVISNASGFFENIAARLGWSSRRLNYKNLTRFCREHEIALPMVEKLEANKDIEDQYKTILLMHYLDQQNDPKVMGQIAEEFSRAFVTIQERPELASLAPWIRKFAYVRDLPSLQKLMREVPPGTSAELVAQLWQDTILPVVVKNNKTIGFWQSLHLKGHFDAILAKATSSPGERWDSGWADVFVAYTRQIFPENSFTPPARPASPEGGEAILWAREFTHARDLATVQRLMRNVPRGTSAELVARLWKETLLPIVIENNKSIGSRRSLQLDSDFDALLARAKASLGEEWDSRWADAFDAYTRQVFPDDSFKRPAAATGCRWGFTALAS